MITATLPILNDDYFSTYKIYNASRINLTLPADSVFEALYDSIYEPDDWRVYSVHVDETADHGSLVFIVKVARNSMTTVFKVLIPMIANAILVMLSTSLKTKARLQVGSLHSHGARCLYCTTFPDCMPGPFS